jgi:hypothetical protein
MVCKERHWKKYTVTVRTEARRRGTGRSILRAEARAREGNRVEDTSHASTE